MARGEVGIWNVHGAGAEGAVPEAILLELSIL